MAARVVGRRRSAGLENLELELARRRVSACVSGPGNLAAARAAALLLAGGAAGGLLVVGTCGSLRRGLGFETRVHCRTAWQVGRTLREGRSPGARPPGGGLESRGGGARRRVLAADRPLTGLWRRWQLARAGGGGAVGAVASAAGRPWAALRVVTDQAGPRKVPKLPGTAPPGRVARPIRG